MLKKLAFPRSTGGGSNEGADITEEATGIFKAALEGNTNKVREYISKQPRSVQSTDRDLGWTVLHFAAYGGHDGAVRLLLSRNANIHAKSDFGDTPLALAAGQGRLSVVQILLAALGPGSASIRHHGPLLAAAQCERNAGADVIKALLRAGSDIRVVNKEGRGVLHVALAGEGFNRHVLQALINERAEVDAVDGDGCTPLHLAVMHGYVEAATMLLEAGADVSIADNAGWTALMCAAFQGYVSIVKLLLKHKAPVRAPRSILNNALQSAAARGSTRAVIALLDSGVDVNLAGGKYGNALQAAAFRGRLHTVRNLVMRGAEIDQPGGKFESAIKAAEARRHRAVAEWLRNYEKGLISWQGDKEVNKATGKTAKVSTKDDEDGSDDNIDDFK